MTLNTQINLGRTRSTRESIRQAERQLQCAIDDRLCNKNLRPLFVFYGTSKGRQWLSATALGLMLFSQPAVEIALEEEDGGAGTIKTDMKANVKPRKSVAIVAEQPAKPSPSVKPKRKVAFHSDRPELYDF